MNIIELSKESSNYKFEGYIWMSDQKYPESNPSKLNAMLNIADTDNPFIIEGQLYCEHEQKSYSIKHVDENHIIVEYDLNELNKKVETENWKKEEKCFIANRINTYKLKFLQYWKPVGDKFCENMEDPENGMKVLTPSAFVFAGFVKNKQEEDRL